MGGFLQDMRYAVRMIARERGFALTAVFTLALGIGATSAVFSVVNGVLLRPFPFAQPERLVVVWEYIPSHPLKYMFSSPPDFADWATETGALESVAAFRPVDLNRTDIDPPERIQGANVTGGLFATLGVAPHLGRVLTAEDDQPGAAGAVVLSYGYWQTRFGGAGDAVGRTILLNGEPFLVAGVMPRGFQFPVPFGLASSVPAPAAEMWTPFRMNYGAGQRGAHFLYTIARLREGVTRQQAEAAMMALGARIAEKDAGHRERSIRLFGLQDQVVAGVVQALYVLLGAVGLVLLIACANVANMQLAHATSRTREISVRAALGASRGRLLRMLLVESAVLSLAGGAAGLLLADAGVRLVTALGPQSIPRISEVALDESAVAFTFVVAVVAGILFGMAPALQASRVSLVEALQEGGRGGSAGAGASLRQALVVAEVALSLMLLVSAGLLLKGFVHLQSTEFGFQREQVFTAGMALPGRDYDTPEKREQFFSRLLDSLAAQPGVQAAGATLALPLATNRQGTGFTVEGRTQPGPEVTVAYGLVTPGYLEALRIPVVRGRNFTPDDRTGQPFVVMINEALARQFFPGADAIGQRVRLGNASDKVFQIVGVSGDVRHDLTEFGGFRPMVWRPYSQAPLGLPMTLVVRSERDAAELSALLRGQVALLDPKLPIHHTRSMDAVFSLALAQPRFSATVLGLFAVVALALAALGVYGVLAYSVSRRTREIGIRMALGAQPGQVFRLVVGQGMALVGVGVPLGLAGALATTRVLQTMLFGVSSADPTVLLLIPLVLLAAAIAACLGPAWRAMRLDPLAALRHE